MMSLLFSNCNNLQKIPDISKWDNIMTCEINIYSLLFIFLQYLEDIKEFSDALISFRKEAKDGNYDDDIHLPNFEINIPFGINNFMKIKKYFEEEQLYSLFGLFSGYIHH